MQPLTHLQETGDQVGPAGGQCNHFLARSRAHPACQLPSVLPAKELVVSRFLRARRKSGPNPPFGGCRLTSPCTPLEMQRSAAHHGPEAGPSHFPPPSCEKTKNSRLPAEGGRSTGLIPAPPPVRQNRPSAGQRRHPFLRMATYTHTAAGQRPPPLALRRGGSSSPSPRS